MPVLEGVELVEGSGLVATVALVHQQLFSLFASSDKKTMQWQFPLQ